MKHDLNHLFRERFEGHEAPVPSGTWQGIQAQLTAIAAPGEGGDAVTDLFRERFQGYEMAVDPAVWQSVSTQLGHAGTGAVAASGIWGWVAAGVVAVAIGAGAYLWVASDPVPDTAVAQTVEEPAAPGSDAGGSGENAPVSVMSGTAQQHQEVTEEPVPMTEEVRIASERPATDRSDDAVRPGGTAEARMEVIVPVTQPALPGTVPTTNPTLVEAIVSEMTAQADAAVEAEKEPRVQDQAGDTDASSEEMFEQPPMNELPKLFLPNTFTPNGDGHNDLYMVGGVEYFDQVRVRAYSVKDNRLVFSTDGNEAWSGNGCSEGYYLVAVEAISIDGRLVTEGKVVFLNRSHLN